jgi:hypothetical protein
MKRLLTHPKTLCYHKDLSCFFVGAGEPEIAKRSLKSR